MENASINAHLQIKTVSEANKTGEHWTKKHKRHKLQKMQVWVWFQKTKPQVVFPCEVKLTRISPRFLDSDNLQSAFKYIRDEIARNLNQNDNSPLIDWTYFQQKGSDQFIKIEISKK
jgi:hypothetical protein